MTKGPAAAHAYESTCQWVGPEQDPLKAPLQFCGRPATFRSYCNEHAGRVYLLKSSTRVYREQENINE